MYRTMTIALAGIVWGCDKGGSSDDDDDTPELPIILSTVNGEYEVGDVEVVDDTCRGGVSSDYRTFAIKLDQVSTGLSVLVDPDVGWVPCEGSVESFECEWGNAPYDTVDGIWTWTLVGAATPQRIEATITLVVTCAGGNQCEECSVVWEYSGPRQGAN